MVTVVSTETVMDRFALAAEAENKFAGYMLYRHNRVMIKVGQETWLPKWVYAHLRRIHDDETIEAIRHFPDFDTGKALVQVKAAPSASEYPTVTIEKASYDVALKIHRNGARVLVVWYLKQEDKFLAGWVNELNPSAPDTPREDTNGSHTPYLVVRKAILKPLQEFTQYI